MPRSTTSRYAALVLGHGLRLHEVRRLTPRIIEEVYGHPRDSKGELVVSEMPAELSVASRAAQLIALIEAGIVKATPEQLEELKRRLDGSGHTSETDH